MGELQRTGSFPEVPATNTRGNTAPLPPAQHDSGLFPRDEAASYTSRVTPVMPMPAWSPDRESDAAALTPLPPAVTVRPTRAIDASASAPSRAVEPAKPAAEPERAEGARPLDATEPLAPVALLRRPRRNVQGEIAQNTWSADGEADTVPFLIAHKSEPDFGRISMEAFPLVKRVEREFVSDGTTLMRDSAHPVEPLWPPPAVADDFEDLFDRPASTYKPPLVRRVFSKLLFAVIFSAVLALLVYEVALIYGITWGDVQAFTKRFTG